MPALIIEFDRLPARWGAVGMRMLVPQLEVRRRGRRALLPELFDRLMIDPIVQWGEEQAGQCAVLKARVEAFEPGDLLPHRLGNVRGTAAGHPLERARYQPQHALLMKATREGAHGVGVRVRGFCPLRRWPVGK